MGIFILAAFLLIAFAAYRVYLYQKQRQIEEMATNAQAYVSAEIVEMLQRIKAIVLSNGGHISPELKSIQDLIHNQLENLSCHTDSEASVREYLSTAKQDLAILQVKLKKISDGQPIEDVATTHTQTPIENEFDALK